MKINFLDQMIKNYVNINIRNNALAFFPKSKNKFQILKRYQNIEN